jgi:hypothetical protein
MIQRETAPDVIASLNTRLYFMAKKGSGNGAHVLQKVWPPQGTFGFIGHGEGL